MDQKPQKREESEGAWAVVILPRMDRRGRVTFKGARVVRLVRWRRLRSGDWELG